MNNRNKNVLNNIRHFIINIPCLKRETLLNDAIVDFNSRLLQEDQKPASHSSDSSFLDRIMVNYVRHKLVSYQDKLHYAHRSQVRNTAYFMLKRKILDRIKETYPFLANECDRQRQFIGD